MGGRRLAGGHVVDDRGSRHLRRDRVCHGLRSRLGSRGSRRLVGIGDLVLSRSRHWVGLVLRGRGGDRVAWVRRRHWVGLVLRGGRHWVAWVGRRHRVTWLRRRHRVGLVLRGRGRNWIAWVGDWIRLVLRGRRGDRVTWVGDWVSLVLGCDRVAGLWCRRWICLVLGSGRGWVAWVADRVCLVLRSGRGQWVCWLTGWVSRVRDWVRLVLRRRGSWVGWVRPRVRLGWWNAEVRSGGDGHRDWLEMRVRGLRDWVSGLTLWMAIGVSSLQKDQVDRKRTYRRGHGS